MIDIRELYDACILCFTVQYFISDLTNPEISITSYLICVLDTALAFLYILLSKEEAE